MSIAGLVEKYARLLAKLLPKGRVWDGIRQENPEVFEAYAGEYCRVDERVRDLLVELDPLTATDDDLLGDWETLLGLPDECESENQSLELRQQNARRKLAAEGGSDAEYFESLAEDLGFSPTTVTDYVPFRVGKSQVGQALTNDFEIYFTVGMTVGNPLLNAGWYYFFQVDTPASNIDPFEVGIDQVGEPLVVFGNFLLECTILREGPAHTAPFFTFS